MNDDVFAMRDVGRAQRTQAAAKAAEKSAKPEKKREADGCREGAGYLDAIPLDGRGNAQRCAASLGKDHYVRCETKNIGDGLPGLVWQTTCWVMKRRK